MQSSPPPREFSGHVAIVSGAGSALGRAVASRLAREGAHLVLCGDDMDTVQQTVASLPAGSTHIASGDPVAESIAMFGGVDLFVALEPMMRDDLERLERVFQRQGIGGALVGLETAQDKTVELPHIRGENVRANVVQIADHAEPALVAEAIAFLASARAAATDRASVPVGFGLS